jgi:hypothetical protein
MFPGLALPRGPTLDRRLSGFRCGHDAHTARGPIVLLRMMMTMSQIPQVFLELFLVHTIER